MPTHDVLENAYGNATLDVQEAGSKEISCNALSESQAKFSAFAKLNELTRLSKA